MTGVPEFDGYGGQHNTSFMSVGKDGTNFATNPNTTATRFYNPKQGSTAQSPSNMGETQTRFMQNFQTNRTKQTGQ